MPISIETEHRCDECGDDLYVALPERLIEDTHTGKVLLFVGSGASTEAHRVMPDTFYDQIRAKVDLGEGDISFPEVMSAYVARFSRSDLIGAFFNRKRYIDSFPSLRRQATRFHRAVGQIPFFREIVTTNWDDYFEEETGAVPLVQGADFDYWDLPQRKVLKIHGSMLNPGSIVASQIEYDRSLEALRSGAVGTAARHLIATHSVVFIGYSLRDDDIKHVIEALRSDMGSAARPTYFVHPSSSFIPPLPGGQLLQTSAAYFVELLDDALVDAGYLLPLALYERVAMMNRRLREARTRFDESLPPWRFPLAIMNHAYQDGLADAFNRIQAARRSGDDRRHHELLHRAADYREVGRRALKARRYWDAAYIEGYKLGLWATGEQDTPVRELPVYYCPGVGAETSYLRVAAAIRKGRETHAGAYAWAARQTRKLPEGMFFTHTPFLPEY
jgi:hypothetical protein